MKVAEPCSVHPADICPGGASWISPNPLWPRKFLVAARKSSSQLLVVGLDSCFVPNKDSLAQSSYFGPLALEGGTHFYRRAFRPHFWEILLCSLSALI